MRTIYVKACALFLLFIVGFNAPLFVLVQYLEEPLTRFVILFVPVLFSIKAADRVVVKWAAKQLRTLEGEDET